VKFSLAEMSTQYATDFALEMKKDPFLKNFKTYNPNAWCKKSCDPKFINMQHPCRGTLATCTIPEEQNLAKDTKRPCATSCWRLAFRFHQEECKASNGFMIQVEELCPSTRPAHPGQSSPQVEEHQGLGDGQKIETEMAKQVGLKIFRTYTNVVEIKPTGAFWEGYEFNGIDAISKAVQEWYENGCVNRDLENVFVGCQKRANENWFGFRYNRRPRYEKM